MGRIFYIMGKSSSGKDTIYSRLLRDKEFGLKNVLLYTTRPVRQGEADGREYHFVDEERFRQFMDEGKVIEYFSEENLERAGIKRRFQNVELESCMEEIREYIRSRSV